jgi:hypothetical protein
MSTKPKHVRQQNKSVEEIKESMGVISKAMPSLDTGSVGILFGEPIHIPVRKHFG